ncbi:MAG: BlaI/MecI/CopY family transcriptional regulator [Rheinheimera sp.]|jgi:predicted transcriptional regulator|nr:MAG: BlaI/MecI/CopY family transcriptional regulator [Rheinheimera sp.]
MARPKSNELTAAEQKVMQVLWQSGPLTVREIAEALNQQQQLAYTTVQTLCRILLDKGHVSCEKQGKAFLYQATTVQQEARSQALLALVKKFFGGSPDLLAQHLISESTLSDDLASQLQQKINEAAASKPQANQASAVASPNPAKD